MEVPRLWVISELQLPAYTIAPIGPLAWEPPYATSSVRKKKKDKKKKKRITARNKQIRKPKKPPSLNPISAYSCHPLYGNKRLSNLVF